MSSIQERGARLLAIGAGGDGFDSRLKAEGFDFQSVPISRKGLDPFADAGLFLSLVKFFKTVKPTVVHSFTIKPAIYANLAAALAGVPVRIVTITGLGHAFTTGNRLLRTLVEFLYRVSLSRADVIYFQNEDDRALFLSRGLVPSERVRLVSGSGVDLQRFGMKPLPCLSGQPPVFLMIGRLLREKGVQEYLEAAALVKREHPDVQFLLVGGRDERNPSALSEGEVADLRRSATVRWLGEVDDVTRYIEQADVVVLPSYREGLPRSLLEAAAMGRATIATDVPGCRAAVEDGQSGILVPAQDARGLATAMIRLIRDPGAISRMGAWGRQRVVDLFDERKVIALTLEGYRQTLEHKHGVTD